MIEFSMNNIYIGAWIAQLVEPQTLGFPGSSAGKESSCNAGDPHSIPEPGRSLWEGIGYTLQYSWVSLVAQTEMNLPAMWETWFQSLGWEDPLEEGMASVFLPGESPWTEEPGGLQYMGSQKVGQDWAQHSHGWFCAEKWQTRAVMTEII